MSSELGDFHGLPGVVFPTWHNPASLGNILALCDIVRHARVTMDSAADNALLVHCPSGTLRFRQADSGLYIYHPLGEASDNTSTSVSAYSLIQTVAKNKTLFTRKQLEAADRARELARLLNRPSDSLLEHILNHGHLLNCSITADDVKRARQIYGPDISFLKGHQTNSGTSPHVPTLTPIAVPPHILQHHSNVTLCIDFFYVQRICFLHCISRTLGFRHTIPVDDRSKDTMLAFLTQVLRTYIARGFRIQAIHADREFECIRNDIAPIALQTRTTNGHVPEVERSIRTMKEDCRSIVHGLPFQRLPKAMIQALVTEIHSTLNFLPRLGQPLLEHTSPATIVTGAPRIDYASLKFEFGAYVQIFDRTTNDLRARTLGAIALGPTRQGDHSYNFLSLRTGRVFPKVASACTAVPITDIAIRRLEQLAKNETQPRLQDSNLLVEWRPDQLFDEDEYDADYSSDDDSDNDDDDLLDYVDPDVSDALLDGPDPTHEVPTPFFPTPPPLGPGPGDPPVGPPGANDHGHRHEHDTPTPDETDPFPDQDTPPNPMDEGTVTPIAQADAVVDEEMGATTEEIGANDEKTGANDKEMGANIEEIGANASAPTTGNKAPTEAPAEEPTNSFFSLTPDQHAPRDYNLRANRQRSYDHRLANQMDTTSDTKSYEKGKQLLQINNPHVNHLRTLSKTISGMMFTQMSARKGIKVHGELARNAIKKEFKQMIDKHVYSALRKKDLTPEQLKRALHCVNLIKEKRSGELKGRHCANGKPQRAWYQKHETTSPTACVDAIILSLIVDAYEGRDVAVADITGAYLNAIMDELVIMRLTGEDVTLMCEVCPEFKDYIENERGRKVLYLKLDRALYGCVRSALLWYKMFSQSLLDMGFTLNPYDNCVANATIDGKQCTIVFYVDDNKISHEDPAVVTRIIKTLEEKYGVMAKTRGSKHDFLGMSIELTDDRTVKISMRRYLEEAISESGLDIKRESSTPATRRLFDVDEDSVELEEADKSIFRSVVSKLLYVALRGRPDLLLAVCYLSTRVANPTHEDRDKLKRTLEYIKGTLDLYITLGATSLDTMYTFVDAAYGVHADMKSHTGGSISFGLGSLMNRSSKQKIVTKSSTEAELVGASDYLSHNIWIKNFMAGQGFHLTNNFFEQDNESAIRLERNGRASAGQRSRHINIRHFWITDRLKTDGIALRHCDTEAMLADFLTKPLQGALFRKFRDVLLGYLPLSAIQTSPDTLEERVVELGPASPELGSSGSPNVARETFPRTRTDFGQNSPRRTYGERTRSEWEWDKNQVASAADPRKAKKVSWASVVKFGIGNNSAAANEIEHPHSVQSRSTNNVL